MEMMDQVEVIVEKEEYAKEGVHKGMQGWICLEENIDGYWLVNFPGYGEADDVAEAPILEEDLMLLPDGFSSVTNEEIRDQYEKSNQHGGK